MPNAAEQSRRPFEWPLSGMAFGGDYNPEQWPREVWREDVRLMVEAGVTMVTLGVFSWGSIETADGVYDFTGMDEVVELLHGAGIAIDMATPTASPPIWLQQQHPQIVPVSREGVHYSQGGRLGWCPSSDVWREYALRIAGVVAERYAAHSAVRMWHVSNELGGGNRHCYCDASAAHFRRWLAERHGTVERLNQAWGTAFWGHRYGSFDEVLPPRDSESAPNPALVLDFDRFSSDALLEHYLAERAVIRQFSERPITTNFMVAQGPDVVDYARWAPHMDVLANDHYSLADDPQREQELAFSADRMRGLDTSRPWMMMEHSTSAVNWQRINRSKDAGELARNSLSHVARGSDGVMFFQWRASTAGAEQFHSAMLPHAGERSKVFEEVRELGATLASLSEVTGTLVEPARVAILFDDEAGWAWRSGEKPHHELHPSHAAREYHRALFNRGILCDVVAPWADLSRYDLVIVPALYLTSEADAASIASAARSGAVVAVTYLSGIVDPTNRVIGGGYPGAFRDLLGVFGEEFYAVLDGEQVSLDRAGWTSTTWSERVHPDDSEVVARYETGQLAGSAAITRRTVGDGEAWYVSTRLETASVDALVEMLLAAADIGASVPVAPGLEAVRRVAHDRAYLFLLNHTTAPVTVAANGTDVVTNAVLEGEVTVPAGGVRVLRERG